MPAIAAPTPLPICVHCHQGGGYHLDYCPVIRERGTTNAPQPDRKSHLGVVLLLGVLGLLGTAGCDRDGEAPRARNALQGWGFTHVELGEPAWFMCPQDANTYTWNFRARNTTGTTVEGYVCCSLYRSCSVQFP